MDDDDYHKANTNNNAEEKTNYSNVGSHDLACDK